jgi:DNA replication protein DnaC
MHNLILCGPTGVGKSWLACALGHKACRDNRSVLYQRVPKLFAELALARGDGRYARILRGLTGVQLLILDDWGLEPLDAGARRDLYEILEERYGRRSTILTSQIPVDKSRCTRRAASNMSVEQPGIAGVGGEQDQLTDGDDAAVVRATVTDSL